MTERTRILELRAKNIKCLREVEINDVGDILEIRGDSGQGKTSILETIEAGLRGLDPAMVRNGESAAEITLHLSDALIKRTVPANGDREVLRVTDPVSGKPIERAKEFLRTLCGTQVFRPVEWVRLGGGEAKGRTERLRAQRDQLLASMPLNYTPDAYRKAVAKLGDDVAEALAEVNLDHIEWHEHALVVCAALQRACYDYRAIQNARAEDAEGAVQHTPKPEQPAPKKSLADCEAAEAAASAAWNRAQFAAESRKSVMDRADQLNMLIEDGLDLPTRKELERDIEVTTAALAREDQQIEQLRQQLRQAETQRGQTMNDLSALQATRGKIETHEARVHELAELNAQGAGATVSGEDMERLKRELDDARAALSAKRTQTVLDAAMERAVKAKEHAAKFDTLVEFFRDTLPKKLIETLEMPVAGLSVDGEVIRINGVPLHQLGTSQQIHVGVAIAAKLNPKTGFILVDGAESMGRNDRLALAEAAKKEGLQLILTIVDPDAQPANGRVVMRQGERVM